ncbi:TPA: helix-turn-helix transcriptional regulator [Candidatus Woesearchaeota archaeon]|nr:helix-turn-helix transcriptional regulator [Candidatus Woesearchaeota archaeon]
MAKKQSKQTFLLVSLSEEKTKKLANVITSASARKILDYLATKGEDDEVTETQISKDLKLPLSTVHYNLQQLQAGNLVDVDEFHYSKKGKEVNHYKLANKYIIIAPSAPTQTIRDRLKSLLPVALLAAGAAALIQVFSRLSQPSFNSFSLGAAQKSAVPLANEAIQDASASSAAAAQPLVEEVAAKAVARIADQAPIVADYASQAASTAQQTSSIFSNIALWFIIGAVFALIAYLIIEKIRKRD